MSSIIALSECVGQALSKSSINAEPRLDVVIGECDGLRRTEVISAQMQLPTGQKRKELSEVSSKTLDPRKRLRASSPEEMVLHAQIAAQKRRISELEGCLFKVTEESKARRNADELELSNVQTCLKDMIDRAETNRELMRKLQADGELKELAARSALAELEARMKKDATTANSISKVSARLEYLERERKYLKGDVQRYRSNALTICEHYKSKMQRYEEERACRRQVRSSSRLQPESTSKDANLIQSARIAD
ncbi:hypothetical protein C8R43DRAFT_1135436 [Mycena crocata]|nr:hypothetical protein C8R43DRAFT_1135436 [Mycena crocata]